MKDSPYNNKGKETEESEVVDPYYWEPLDDDGCQTLIVLKEITPTIKKKWLRNNIFLLNS